MKYLTLALVCVLIIHVAGCGGESDQVEVFPVSGTVLMNGKPVAKAFVQFNSLDKKPSATATTANDGSFQLTTYEFNDGAAAGKYEVMISKNAPPATEAEIAHDSEGGGDGSYEPDHSGEDESGETMSLINPKWSMAGNGLEKEVTKEGPNEFELTVD